MNLYESLLESAETGELILIDGGLCKYHRCVRHDQRGQITIYIIIVLPERRRQGIAAAMLEQLKKLPGVTSIFAKCPKDTSANKWYGAMGFVLEGEEEVGKNGKIVNLWRLKLGGYQEKPKQKAFF